MTVCFLSALLVTVAAAGQVVELPFRHDLKLVETTYAHVTSAATIEDARVMYSELAPGMKGDLWLYQWHLYLTTMPQLTVEQRAVIFEAVGMVLAGYMDNRKDDPSWVAWAQAARTKHLSDAEAVFDRPTTKLLFMRLGSPATATVDHTLGPGLHIRPDTIPDCSCNATNDYCCIWPTCLDRCRTGIGFRCTFTQDGCGDFWQDPCNGICD